MKGTGWPVRVTIRCRWWLRWYIDGVAIMAHLSGADPDARKVEAIIRRGLVVEIEPVRHALAA